MFGRLLGDGAAMLRVKRQSAKGHKQAARPGRLAAGGTDGTALRDPDDSGAAREPNRHPVAETGEARTGRWVGPPP